MTPEKKRKSRKAQIAIAISTSVLVLLLVFARVTGALQYFNIPTGANEPTIRVGTHFFSSNLKAPERLDFICYRMNDSIFGKQIWVHRLCGLPGDKIEIRNDTLFVNGLNIDNNLNLRKRFIVRAQEFSDSKQEKMEMVLTENRDSVIVYLETIKDSSIIKTGKPFLEGKGADGDPYISKLYGQQWTVSNFGPYVVPKNKYFVIGDNRNMSQDSRFTGPLDQNQYYGTVLGKR